MSPSRLYDLSLLRPVRADAFERLIVVEAFTIVDTTLISRRAGANAYATMVIGFPVAGVLVGYAIATHDFSLLKGCMALDVFDRGSEARCCEPGGGDELEEKLELHGDQQEMLKNEYVSQGSFV